MSFRTKASERLIGRKFVYWPGVMDKFDPKVISGRPIYGGEIVTITDAGFDPAHKFVRVKDNFGNEQSVWKAALVPFTKKTRNNIIASE